MKITGISKVKRIISTIGFVVIIAGITNGAEFPLSGNGPVKETEQPEIYQKLQVKTGFSLGWDYPYSAGIELSFLFNELIDCNVGFGLGLSGKKLGLGARMFPVRNNSFSPMFGAYFYHATGLKDLNVSVNDRHAVYDITPDNAVLLNAGGRFRFGKGHYVIAGIGYSIPFKGEKAVYKSGSTAESVENFANILGTGGLSLNIGLLFKVSKGNFRSVVSGKK